MELQNKKKNVFTHPAGLAFSVVFLLVIFYLRAYGHNQTLDYIAINGTFQSYNVIRRLLSGQIPFVDFTVYLGSGHLFLTAAVTFLFGGSYAAGVVAYDYVSSLSILMLCFGFCAVRFRRNWLVPALLSLYFLFLPVNRSLEIMAKGGNSARNIRGLILPVCILIYLLISKRLEKHEDWSEGRQFYFHIVLLSCTAGLSTVWGNDYGVVCCIAIFLLTMLLTVIRFKSIRRTFAAAGLMLLGISLTVFVLAVCITRGHPLIWLRKNFFSAYYQSWYFNMPHEHPFYYYDVDLSVPVLLCLALCAGYLILLIRKISWENVRRFGVPAFAMLSCFGAAEEYKLFSGGGWIFHDFLIGTLLILIYTELVNLIRLLIVRLKPAERISEKMQQGQIVLGAAAGMIAVSWTVTDLPWERTGTEVPELGGYLLNCAEDLQTSLEIVGNRRVFSAYASALETVTDQYQPSGTDYIIHCLTDEARQHYMDVFRAQDFDCVSTIHLDYDLFGPWIRNANWFFYREVYAGYHFVGNNSYADYWEPGAAADSCLTEGIQVSIRTVSDTAADIVVTAPENVSGVADVYLEYESEIRPGRDSFLLHQNIVGVLPAITHEDCVDSWTLPPSGSVYIPIEIRNGKGQVQLASYPAKAAALTVTKAESERIFLDKALP